MGHPYFYPVVRESGRLQASGTDMDGQSTEGAQPLASSSPPTLPTSTNDSTGLSLGGSFGTVDQNFNEEAQDY